MGNWMCKCGCVYAAGDHSWILAHSRGIGGTLGVAMDPQNLLFSDSDSVDGGSGEVRKKVDGLTGADRRFLQSIEKPTGVVVAGGGGAGAAAASPFWEADAVCECHRHLIKQMSGYIMWSTLVSAEDSLLALSPRRPPEIPSQSNLNLFVVTWNMNGRVSAVDLAKLVSPENALIDLYVVGLQEVPNSDVLIAILQTLGSSYNLVAAAVMPSLRLYIFGRKSLKPFLQVKKIDKLSVGGFGGVARRQKGAVAVAMTFKETPFLFVACHLSPHVSNLEERNYQIWRISHSLFSRSCFRVSSCLASPVAAVASKASSGEESPKNSIVDDFDLVVWLGDLNYRIEDNRISVDSLIRNRVYESLWPKDQLSRGIAKGEVFQGFCEGPLTFKPTYKFDIGSDRYDTSSKGRVPAWTDRILYKVKRESSIEATVHDYTSIDHVKSSDHRPVKAILKLNGVA